MNSEPLSDQPPAAFGANAAVPDPAVATAAALARADRSFVEGDYLAAVRDYEQLVHVVDVSTRGLVQYRLALSLEGLGESLSAQQIYRTVVESDPGGPLGARAKFAQARVWAKSNRPRLAAEILAELILDQTLTGSAGRGDLGDVLHLFGHVLAADLAPNLEADLTQDLQIAAAELTWNHTHALRSALLAEPSPADADPMSSGIRLLAPEGQTAATIFLQAALSPLSAQETVDQVARVSGRTTAWSPAAARIASAHRVRMHFEELSAAMLLDALLDPLGLTWTFEEEAISVSTQDELHQDLVRQRRHQIAERTLRQAAYQYPDHPWAAHSYLMIGNLAARRQDYKQAQQTYEQLERMFSRSVVLAECWFNLGKVHLLQGQGDVAREAYHRAVDHGRGHPLEPVAYLYVGRLFLEADQAHKAVHPLRRATAFASDTDLRAKALLTLAAAYLLSDQPHAANLVLMERRADFEGPNRDRAALLASLARYRSVTTDPSRKTYEGRMLMSALSHVGPGDFFGEFGAWLIGEAYRDVGLPHAMADSLEAGLKAPYQFPLQDKMLLSLAMHHLDVGKPEQAVTLLEGLARHGQTPRKKLAHLVAIQAQIKREQPEVALTRCRQTLGQSTDPETNRAVLRVMSRIYEQLGDHESAVMCLTGVTPP